MVGIGPHPISSKPRFTVWLHLEISKPSTSSSHLRLLYSSGRMASGKTKVGAGLGLPPPRKPQGLCTQWTAIDHVGALQPCPLHR